MYLSQTKACVLNALIFILISLNAQAQIQRGFHLFHPVPKEGLREFSIDRPDVTESPVTVDAGHFQLEADLFKWNKNSRGKSPQSFNFLNGLYKFGLTHSWDIHIGIELFNVYQNANRATVSKGYGSTMIRLKHNFWGNDGDTRTGLGVIPYITYLSGTPFSPDFNYGLGIPFSHELNDNLNLGLQPQLDFILNEEGTHETSFFQTVVVAGQVMGNLDFFLEGLAIFSARNNFIINGGLVYNVASNVKLDLASNIGLNDEAPTKLYLGFSFRI